MDFLETAYEFSFEGIKNDVFQYKFISVGDHTITKVISFAPIGQMENWYNLGFGNLENQEGTYRVNDNSERNNKDYDKVLATVFMCGLHFFTLKPESSILFFGNTRHKHVLYKRKISAYQKKLNEHLEILGGTVSDNISLKKVERVIERRGEKTKRVVEEKDFEELSENVEIETLEKFDKNKINDYQFILLELKK